MLRKEVESSRTCLYGVAPPGGIASITKKITITTIRAFSEPIQLPDSLKFPSETLAASTG